MVAHKLLFSYTSFVSLKVALIKQPLFLSTIILKQGFSNNSFMVEQGYKHHTYLVGLGYEKSPFGRARVRKFFRSDWGRARVSSCPSFPNPLEMKCSHPTGEMLSKIAL